jgi:4-hydroxybenzoate polyprenyltransferase
MGKIRAFIQLTRPANVLTAIADIMMGFSVTLPAIYFMSEGGWSFYVENSGDLLWLILATSCLYAGGVVLNDVFDANLDKIERPERPIPSGKISRAIAAQFGFILLLSGMLAAFNVNDTSGFLAMAIGGLAVLYDSFSKRSAILGPINMGACRGVNLMLGMSAVPEVLYNFWFLGFIPLLYIAAITIISRGEVNGGKRQAIIGAFVLYGIVFCSILFLSIESKFEYYHSLPFLILFAAMVLPSLMMAYKTLDPQDIRKAVKAGVISLIVMNATLAAGFAGIFYGLLILSLLPISRYISRSFAVT